MKIIIRVCVWLFVALCILCVGADFILRTASRRPEFQAYVLKTTQEILNRDVKLEHVSASLYGLEIDGLQIAEAGGFENGVFLKVPRGRIFFALSHLLRLHFKMSAISLQQAEVNIIRYEDGTLNVDSLGETDSEESKPSQPDTDESDPADNPLWGLFSITSIDLRNLTISYEDKQTRSFYRASDIYLTAQGFELDKEFLLSLNTIVTYNTPTEQYKIPLALRAKVFLASLDFDEAYIEIINFSLRQDNTYLELSGHISTWDNPLFAFQLSMQNLSNRLFEDVVDLPAFEIPFFTLNATGQFLTNEQELKITKSILGLSGVFATVVGNMNLAQNTHTARGNFTFDFGQLYKWFPKEWKPYILTQGAVKAHLRSQTERVGGTVQVKVPEGSLHINGQYNYAQKTYDAQADFQADLEKTSASFPDAWKRLGLKGELDGSVKASSRQIDAQLHWENGSLFYPVTGHFSNIIATFTVQGDQTFKTGAASLAVSGNLNKGPFTADVSLKQTTNLITAVVNAYSKRVALPPLPPENWRQPKEDFVTDTSLQPVAKTAWPFPPIDLTTNIKIDSLDAPYLYATDLEFTSDLQGITPMLNDAHGVLKLSMGNGSILDLYHLTNANALTKVLFLSVNVVGKVFNSMNVLGVLHGLGKGVVSAVSRNKETEEETRMVVQPMLDENGKPIEMLVPYVEHKTKGQQDFEKFSTEIKFNDGVASIRKGTFVSETMSMRLDGTTDFNTSDVNLKVHAAPGRHEVNGIMPLTVNITGTVADPKGSMRVLKSFSSLVTQGMTKNVVSRNVHKGLKSFFGLFRKKDTEKEPIEDFSVQTEENDSEKAELEKR